MTPIAQDAFTAHLQVGVLDADSVRALRAVLLDHGNEPKTHFIIDLRQADDGQDMTLFALLSAKARSVSEAMGSMTAVRPTQRLTHLFTTVGVHVTQELPAIAVAERVLELSIGLLRT